jgi:hypothetical protein
MGMYSIAEVANFREWMRDIECARTLRKVYKPQMLLKRGGREEAGYYTDCQLCGERIKVAFGDYLKPLDEKFIVCPNSNGHDGHGVWGSAINLILN